jgi:hypothetical protein
MSGKCFKLSLNTYNPSGRRCIWTFFKRHGKTVFCLRNKINKMKEMNEHSIQFI